MGSDISYEDWLQYMVVPPKSVLFEHYMFPNEEIKSAFISNIGKHSEEIISIVLHKFLCFSGPLGSDYFNMEYLVQVLKDNKESPEKAIINNPYNKRLLQYAATKGKIPLYESIQWVLDLLPAHPRDALNVISAFLSIHLGHLPDGRIHGLFDAESIIRARYFDAQVDKSVLYSLTPTEFEHVVEDLYYKMGYKTRMTKASYDGGRDVIATSSESGKKEHIIISCKRLMDNVKPADYREIFAPVEDEKATKGVVVTTSDFSPEAYKLAKRNPRFELINRNELQKLLNEYSGSNWSDNLDACIRSSQDRHPKSERL